MPKENGGYDKFGQLANNKTPSKFKLKYNSNVWECNQSFVQCCELKAYKYSLILNSNVGWKSFKVYHLGWKGPSP